VSAVQCWNSQREYRTHTHTVTKCQYSKPPGKWSHLGEVSRPSGRSARDSSWN